MRILTLSLLTLLLCSCMSAGNLKKNAQFSKAGEAKGNHSALANCIIDRMESSEDTGLNRLNYEVRAYPDIKKTEVNVRGDHAYGSFYGLNIKLNQIKPEITSYEIISFFEFEGKEAVKALNACAEK